MANLNPLKRRPSCTSESLSPNLRYEGGPADINNHEAVQNQAVNQTVNGSQYYGPVNIHNESSVNRSPDEDRKLRDALLASLAFPGMLDRRNNITQPHIQTCQWIFELEQYRTWKTQSHGLLWIKGKPGSGKSTLMSFLHRELRKENGVDNTIHLDFFFHARGSELQRTPLGMLRSLLNQLLRQCQYACVDATASFREKRDAYGDGVRSWEWQRPELERLFVDAILVAASSHSVILFIDALDEAGSKHARAVVTYFHRIHDRAILIKSQDGTRGLKICMSSRHYPIVSLTRGSEIYMEQHNSTDIQRFLQDEMEQTLRFSDRVSDDKDWQHLADEILAHARGVFQWVRSVLNIVFDNFERGHSVEVTKKSLKSLPVDLEEIYAYILHSLMTSSVPQLANESLLLFQWVCFSERPLTPIELMYAMLPATSNKSFHPLRSETEQARIERRIKSLSGGLVEIVHRQPQTGNPNRVTDDADNDDNVETDNPTNDHDDGGSTFVQIIHQTVREFLIAKGLILLFDLCTGNSVKLNLLSEAGEAALIQRCHSSLYWSCLNRLELLDQDSFITRLDQIPASYDHEDWDDRKHTIIVGFPFLTYVCKNIFEHAQKAAVYRSTNPFQDTRELSELERLERIRLLWNICDMTGKSQNDWSLLHIAISYNAKHLAQGLIADGCDLLQSDRNGLTPLHLAARNQQSELCTLLLSSGADVNFVAPCDSEGYAGPSVLQSSFQNDDTTIAELILHAGADVNAQAGFFGTALHKAAFYGYGRVVQTLVDAGADVNMLGDRYGTVLQMAAYSHADLEHIVQILLDAGADVNIQGGKHGTALQAMALYGHQRAMQLLINAGADPNLQGGSHGSALRAAFASLRPRRDIIVKMLRDAGAEA